MRDWRNVVIGVLAIAIVALATLVLKDRTGSPAAPPAPSEPRVGEAVTVLDVVLDRESMTALDVVFDKPLGEKRVGEVLGRDPARIEPKIGGSWRWQSANVLRFEAPQRFALATDYSIALRPERLVGEGQFFDGKTSFSVKTDQFRVEAVDVYEEAAAEQGHVVLRGDLRFNYGVDPRVLATKVRLVDPLLGEEKPVAVSVDGPYWGESIAFTSAPVEKRKEERTLTLTILSDLTPVEGNVSLVADYVKPIPLGSSARLAIRDAAATPGVPDSTIRIAFSSAVDPAVAASFVSVTPAIPYRTTVERSDLVLTGAFPPGETVAVEVKPGLAARDGAALAEAFRKEIALPDLPPDLDFESQGMFLSASGARAVVLESTNVDSAEIAIDRVYRNNVFYLFENFGWSAWRDEYYGDRVQRSLGDRIASETIEIRAPKNRPTKTTLALGRYFEGREPGLYRVAVTRAGGHWGKQRWVLVTDLGVVAKRGRDELLVWSAAFADLAPIAGAEVRLLSRQNQEIASGRTDERGFWRLGGLDKLLSGPTPEEAREPYMIVVERGADATFLVLERAEIDLSGFDVAGAPPAKQGFRGFVYGERDVVRPGETIEGLAVVRDRALAAPPAMPLALRHRDPEGREVGVHRMRSDAEGLAPFAIEVPAYARTGHHTLELVVAEEVIGDWRVQVEEFVPDRISVEIGADAPAAVAGGTLAYDVASAYLFGPPAAGLAVESRVRLLRSSFSAKGFEAFSFENPERTFEDRDLATETAMLDVSGRHRFEVPVPAKLEPPSALEALVTARVREQGGRGVAAMRRIRVHPFPSYVGVRRLAAEGWVEPGTPAAFEIVRVMPEGALAKGGTVRVELWRDRWQSVLRRTASGNFRYESIRDPLREDFRTVELAEGRAEVTFTPREFGAYRVVVTDAESAASSAVEFYASGSGWSPWAIKDPSRIELALDREEYAPGDTAELQVRAPFSGVLLVTIERDGVEHVSTHPLDGNTATIPLPVAASLRPNAYVTATLVRRAGDLEPGSPGRAFGAIPIAVDRTANRIEVAIETPEEIRPKGTLEVAVRAAPGAAVTVAAVDEGILQLVAQKTPDPFAHFYRKLALDVRSYDAFALLLPEPEVEDAAARGGGDAFADLAQFVRTDGIRRAEPVAYWSGVLHADAGGEARTTFRVPEFQGAVRVMAVALDGARFGSAERKTRVRTPLVVLPTVPRVLSFAEEAEISITVRNDTAKEGTFEVALAVEGAARASGETTQAIEIARGAEKTVRFGIRTGEDPGEVRLVASASGNGERTEASERVGVRSDLPRDVLERAGRLEKEETAFPLERAADFRDGTLVRSLRVGGAPLVRFAGKLRHLLHYPYGCTEQTISAAFPLLYMADLAKALDPELFRESDPAALVEDAIRRVRTTQLQGGGFALWPTSDQLHPWTSVYAAHFLVEARRAGYAVDDLVHARALDFVAADATAKESMGDAELERVAYGLYVLSRVGRADLGTMDVLRAKHAARLRPDSRALVAAAYAQAGNREAIDELLRGIDDAETVNRATGTNFRSPIRDRAILLLALLDVAPKDARVAKLVQRLARDADAGPWTTQEGAFALLALGRFYREQAAKGPFAGVVLAGDRELGRFTSDAPATFEPIEGTEPIRIRLDDGADPEAVFYSLETRGIPTDAAYRAESHGLEIERVLLTRGGAPLDAPTVAQGDLVVAKLRVRSLAGNVENVVLTHLLPSGLEVENPRLQTTETLPWAGDASLRAAHVDFRDDRVLVFADLPANAWRTTYVLLRAITPGTFRLPPLQAEAMYDPSLRARGERATIRVSPP